MATNILYRTTVSPTVPNSTTAKLTPLTNVEVDGNWKSLVDSVDLKATINSPTFTGTPLAPTPTQFDNTTKLATTAYVNTLGVHSNGYSSYSSTTTLTAAAFGKTNFYNSASAGTFTLPTPVAATIIMISNIGVGLLTIATPAAQIIYFLGSTVATSFTLKSGESVMLASDGGSYISLAVTQNIASLGAAKSGVNTDLTSITGLTGTINFTGAGSFSSAGVQQLTYDTSGNFAPNVANTQNFGSTLKPWSNVNTNNVNTTSINGGPLAGFRNRIINGSMSIDERSNGTAFTPTGSAYVIDRWLYGTSQASKTTLQQVFDAPPGFYASLRASVASQFISTSTDVFTISQVIEQVNMVDLEFGIATAKSITISFWVKASTSGTYSGALRNQPSTRSYVFSFPVTTSWTKVSIVIPGDTSGTWGVPTATGTILSFNLGTGSNYLTTPGSWQTGNFVGATGTSNFVGQSNGSTFNFTGVQLEVGSEDTQFEMRTSAVEFLLCQRYFERLGYMRIDLYATGTGSDMFFPVPLKVRKRTNAVTIFATSVVTNWVGVNYSNSNKDFVNIAATGVSSAGETNYEWLNCAIDAEL